MNLTASDTVEICEFVYKSSGVASVGLTLPIAGLMILVIGCGFRAEYNPVIIGVKYVCNFFYPPKPIANTIIVDPNAKYTTYKTQNHTYTLPVSNKQIPFTDRYKQKYEKMNKTTNDPVILDFNVKFDRMCNISKSVHTECEIIESKIRKAREMRGYKKSAELEKLLADEKRQKEKLISLNTIENELEVAKREYLNNQHKLRYVVEMTPIANIIMSYRDNSFIYWSDRTFTQSTLDVISRKYVTTYDCCWLYVDMDVELSTPTLIDPEKEALKRSAEVRASELTNREFGRKLKYEGTMPVRANEQSKISNRTNAKVKINANRYTRLGKLMDCQVFKQKVEVKIPTFKYEDFKRKQAEMKLNETNEKPAFVVNFSEKSDTEYDPTFSIVKVDDLDNNQPSYAEDRKWLTSAPQMFIDMGLLSKDLPQSDGFSCDLEPPGEILESNLITETKNNCGPKNNISEYGSYFGESI